MNDIDLNAFTGGGPTPIDWVGKTNYSGNFNGNGHTIDLTLKKTSGDTGLFTSLGDGAVIENFTLNVVTTTGITMTSNSHFGGVVGVINADAVYTMRNLTVTGTLDYNTTSGYLLAGGLIGEIGQFRTLNISNCVADIRIRLNGSSGTSGTLGFGGLIGKITSTVGGNKITISNCYTKGSINVTSSSNRELISGGLVAEIAAGADPTAVNVEIINCYSAMDIIGNKTSGGTVISSGLVGRINTNGTASLTKSIALNPRAIGNDQSFRSYYKRSTVTAETYALDSMLVGASPGAVVSNTDVTLPNGANATSTELSSSAFWRDLDFDGNIWDFTGLSISEEIYPRLIR
jgi:hypothetical protein